MDAKQFVLQEEKKAEKAHPLTNLPLIEPQIQRVVLMLENYSRLHSSSTDENVKEVMEWIDSIKVPEYEDGFHNGEYTVNYSELRQKLTSVFGEQHKPKQ